jgi:hypothetical protein
MQFKRHGSVRFVSAAAAARAGDDLDGSPAEPDVWAEAARLATEEAARLLLNSASASTVKETQERGRGAAPFLHEPPLPFNDFKDFKDFKDPWGVPLARGGGFEDFKDFGDFGDLWGVPGP